MVKPDDMVLMVRCDGFDGSLGGSTVAEEDDELASLRAVSRGCLKLSRSVQAGGEVAATLGESFGSTESSLAMDGTVDVSVMQAGDL